MEAIEQSEKTLTISCLSPSTKNNHNKSLNYGILKPKMIIDESRLNLDYLAGIIYTDGSIYYNTKTQKCYIQIAQDNLKFLKAIQLFFEKYDTKSKIYYKNRPKNKNGVLFPPYIRLYKKSIIEFFKNYSFKKTKDKLSFFSGMIDGDGCFCSHKSSSGIYWRFQFGTKKQREINKFKESIYWSGINYRIHKKKSGITCFDVYASKELIKLIELIKERVIIKKEVIELIYPQLLKFESKKWKTCKYCNEKFLHRYSSYFKKEFHCKKKECLNKYDAERMRKLRRIRKFNHSFATHMMNNGTDTKIIQKILGHNSIKSTQRYTHVSNRDIKNLISPLDVISKGKYNEVVR